MQAWDCHVVTDLAVLEVFAVCTECGASVSDWPQRVLPLEYPLLTWTDRDELALHVAGSCGVCDSPCLEIRVEDRSPRRARATVRAPQRARRARAFAAEGSGDDRALPLPASESGGAPDLH